MLIENDKYKEMQIDARDSVVQLPPPPPTFGRKAARKLPSVASAKEGYLPKITIHTHSTSKRYDSRKTAKRRNLK